MDIIQERIRYIYKECRKVGITHWGAIGLLGNLQGETSDFDPKSLETMYKNRFKLTDDEYVRRADAGEKVYNDKTFIFDSAGFGIAQWTWWERKKGLLEFAKQYGRSVGDLDVQVLYMFTEMKNRYTKTWQTLTTTNSYVAAVKICVTEYEKPANAQDAIYKRTNYAEELLSLITEDFLQDNETEEKPNDAPAIPSTPPTIETSKINRIDVIKLALSQVGYKEKRTNENLDDFTANAGINNYTKYARDLDAIANFYNGEKQGFAWCDIFVDWCFITVYGVLEGLNLLCQKQGGSGAGCTYSMQYFQAKGQFIKRKDGKPQVGDQIFFGSGLSNSNHTGLVYAVDDNKVYTIEGNTTDSASVVAEGTSVLKKSYSLSHGSIIGYGRPNWQDGYTGNGFEITLTPPAEETPKEEEKPAVTLPAEEIPKEEEKPVTPPVVEEKEPIIEEIPEIDENLNETETLSLILKVLISMKNLLVQILEKLNLK